MSSVAVPWWSPWVAVAALVTSVGFNVWQAVDRKRDRIPDVTVRADKVQGSSLDPGGRSATVFLLGDVLINGSATIVSAGVASSQRWRRRVERPAIMYKSKPRVAARALPMAVSDDVMRIRVQLPGELPDHICGWSGMRLWVETSSGHRFTSPNAVAPWEGTFAGPYDASPIT